jgi:hypothetical protein
MTCRTLARTASLHCLAACAALAAALLVTLPVRAHEYAMESVMNAFLRIEPHEAHLLVRLPLHLLKPARVPQTGREIDLANAGPATERALAALAEGLAIEESGRRLTPVSMAGRYSLPSDRSFESVETAAAHIAQAIAPGTSIYYDQGYFDAHLVYPISSAASTFHIRTTVAPELKDHLKLTLRYLPAGQEPRAMIITRSSGRVALDPSWVEAASGFTALGIGHILGGLDHLLFLLCLIVPLRGVRQILTIVTLFTLGHSVTLVGAALDLGPTGAWFPPLVETLIAASIIYMAVENIVGANVRRRALITTLFGLVHGFGFAYGLREELQFAGNHLLVSLLAFNVGIEIGQVLALAVMLPALALLTRHLGAPRVVGIVISVLVAHTSWHWMTERAEVLWKVEWPALQAGDVPTLAFWIAGLLLGGLAVQRLTGRILARPEPVVRPGAD